MRYSNRSPRTLSAALLLTLGCADSRSPADDVATASDTGTSNTDADTDVGESGSSTADTTATSDGDSDGVDDGPTTTTGDGDGDGDSADTDNTKFDLGIVPDAGAINCGGGGDPEFSYLWAANSDQGTISKLETATVTEVGRYIVRPDSAGSPSRTSVSLSGNVAVANRNGGVSKIYANSDDCEESNGMPGLQTSNSQAFLPWGQEECLAWYTPFGYSSQRPVAWAPGVFNEGTCAYEDEQLWTSGNNQNGQIDIVLLDGEDGSVTDMVSVPTGPNTLDDDFYGIYGGAVDGDGNFWGSQLGGERMVRVDRSDLSYEIIWTPGYGGWYGMTVDVDGMVWLCGYEAARYDPMAQTWQVAQVGGGAGCMADAEEDGLLWLGGGGGIVGINRATLAVEKTCPVDSYGISIDFEGYIWAVAYGSAANKVDPDTCQTWSYNGLVGAYTYSDMTGYALTNAGTPSR